MQPLNNEIEMKDCQRCETSTPHAKYRPGDKPGYYWKCLYCGHSPIDGDGNIPAVI